MSAELNDMTITAGRQSVPRIFMPDMPASIDNTQENQMKRITTLLAAAALAAVFTAPPLAMAAGNDIVLPDHTMRASKIIGATVYNEQGQNIGSVVDVLVKNTPSEPTAILSVGDFAGGGTKLIAMPLSHVNLDGAKPMMPTTKQSLASMPVFLFPPNANNGG
jgi:hypothetical protein